ncbi:MAG: hypothetical protein WD766_14245 [Gemmatimonadota bacterium]
MLRRFAALLMLLIVTFSNVETVTGVIRDGTVHHESAAAAAGHAAQAKGEHGHEDGAPHGPQHEHGTQSDHCMHQHGNLLTPRAPTFAIVTHTIPQSFLEPLLWLERFTEPSFRPPQA